jgi:hypothetical protein
MPDTLVIIIGSINMAAVISGGTFMAKLFFRMGMLLAEFKESNRRIVNIERYLGLDGTRGPREQP